MPVDPERLAELFDAALERRADERDALLADACRGDPDLLAAVTDLLHSDAAAPPGFLTSPPLLPPEPPPPRVGRFELLRSLGAGGMGEVFAARDPVLGRTVAVKLLHGARSPLARELLLREGQILARLSHPNIVQLHDTGEHEGQIYLAMEHVDGVTLRTWLLGQPTSWRVRLPPLLDAARGLAAAHAVGLVHGDVKPDNLLVGADGRVRLVDFGLARLQGGGDPAVLAFLGTPGYLDPAARPGAPLDPRSDQFALCVVAWQCLFGQDPFDSLPDAAPRPPPPDREVPPAIAAALRRGLARDPADRFPDMPALIAALAAPLAADPEADLSIAGRSRRAVLVGFAACVAVIDLVIHVRGFDDVAPTAADLARIGALALGVALVLVALAWSRLRTRINRLVAASLVLQIAAMFAHRLLAARLGQDPAEILAVDLLLLGATAGAGGLLAQAWLFGPCALFLAGAAAAAIDLRAAPIAMSIASWGAMIFALVYLRPRP